MATSIYRSYILMSRARFNEKISGWEPYASVAAEGDHFYYHQLKELDATFRDTRTGVVFRFHCCSRLVDEQLSTGRKSPR